MCIGSCLRAYCPVAAATSAAAGSGGGIEAGDMDIAVEEGKGRGGEQEKKKEGRRRREEGKKKGRDVEDVEGKN